MTRRRMAHPRRHDEIRVVAGGILGALIVLAACIAVPVLAA